MLRAAELAGHDELEVERGGLMPSSLADMMSRSVYEGAKKMPKQGRYGVR